MVYKAVMIPSIKTTPAKNAGFILNIDASTSNPLLFLPRLASNKLMITIPITLIKNTNPILSKNGIS